MNGKLADEMLERVNSVNEPDREPTVKLDKDTLRIVNKWKMENLKATISWLCRVADEALEAAKREKAGLSQ